MSHAWANAGENVAKHVSAIDICLSNNLRMPALVLIYSGIDILAALSRASTKADVTRDDFLRWCDKYLVPAGFTECSPLELYSARCAVVHTYSSESALSRRGVAREVIYAWGNRTSDSLQRVIDRVGINRVVVVHINLLAAAFHAGIERFFHDVERDADLADRVAMRSGKLFNEYSYLGGP